MIKRFSNKSQIFLVVIFLLGFVACDNNKSSGGTTPNPNLTAPNNSVASDAGAVSALVTGHVLEKTNDIRGGVLEFLDELAGVPGGGGTEKAVTNFIVDAEPVEGTVDLSETIGCTSGGSRDIIGSADFLLNADGATGTIVGSFTIQYDNCQDLVVLNPSDGPCSVTPTIDGEVRNTINVSFTMTNNDIGGQEVNDDTTVDASTTVALDVSVGSSASDQTYNFSYDLNSKSAVEDPDGTLGLNNQLFDLLELEEFVASSTSSVVCP